MEAWVETGQMGRPGARTVKTFINQYDPRFGYGATEIFFEY
jgi:hypothetical protein